MGFSYKNRDSQRAEMYEKKVNDRVESDLGKTINKVSIDNISEILERLRKVELQLDQLELKTNQLSSTLSQLCIQAIKKKFKAE